MRAKFVFIYIPQPHLGKHLFGFNFAFTELENIFEDNLSTKFVFIMVVYYQWGCDKSVSLVRMRIFFD